MTDERLLASLLAAVGTSPDDVPLRLHVAELLAAAGRSAEALMHCTHALRSNPADPAALALPQRLTAALWDPAAPPAPPTPPEFDWSQAEDQLADVDGHLRERALAHESAPAPPVEDIERPTVRLADVGAMEHVKERLELAFLAPARNPALARAFGATAGGGLLLYGPPGCGKTFLARALAGELGARFVEVGISDVLDMYVGTSERNVAQIFAAARRSAPCCDRSGHDASDQNSSSTRSTRSARNART